MLCRIIRIAGIVLFVLITVETTAQDDPAPDDVSLAVKRGVQFLQSTQRFDGSWSFTGHNVGMTALAGLTLLECEVPASDSRLIDAHQYIRENVSEISQTYDISVALLFLERFGSPKDTELILGLGRRLANSQLVSGGWTYVCAEGITAPLDSDQNLPRPLNRGTNQEARVSINLADDIADNSNTQFAVLGLWAAQGVGMDVREPMERVDQRFRETQLRTGQWNYRPDVKLTADSMSCAGLVSLLLAKGCQTLKREREKDEDSKLPLESLEMASDEIIDRAVRRVARIRIGPKSSTHLIWCLGRVGIALQLTEIGGVAWYERGTRVLLRMQNRDGSWRNSTPIPPSSKTVDTAFALLFLQRSNLTRDLPLLVDETGAKLRASPKHNNDCSQQD